MLHFGLTDTGGEVKEGPTGRKVGRSLMTGGPVTEPLGGCLTRPVDGYRSYSRHLDRLTFAPGSER